MGDVLPLPSRRFGRFSPESRAQSKKDLKRVAEGHAGTFGFDIDGTIDAFPRQMGTLISALHAAARGVYILTGIPADEVTQADIEAKQKYLMALGVDTDSYTELIVVPRPHDENKAKAIAEKHIGVLVDNSKANVKAAAGDCCCLLVWNTKEEE